jgi:endonuclease/exonuclease/phosphatase (EEP) superfamily protein YafD
MRTWKPFRAGWAGPVAALFAAAYAGAEFHGPVALLDNLSNFQPHFAAAFLGCAGWLAVRRQFLPALACLALAAIPLGRVLPWYGDAEAAPVVPEAPGVRLLVSNVYFANRDHQRLLDLLEREDPDVIGLVEVSARWLRRLAPLRARYPYHFEVPNEHHVGIALYSRLPLNDARTLAPGGEHESPVIAGTIATPGGPVQILLAHPASPISAANIQRRNAQIAALARHARAAGGPLVLAGDLNLTMWNRAYGPLVEVAQLRNARQGYGIGPTWPALGPVGVPIDHILASEGVALRNFRVLPGIGSDHRPVAAEFSIP